MSEQEVLQKNNSPEGKEDRIIGKHVFGNLYDIDAERLNDKEFLEKLVLEAVNIAHMKLVEIKASLYVRNFHTCSLLACT